MLAMYNESYSQELMIAIGVISTLYVFLGLDRAGGFWQKWLISVGVSSLLYFVTLIFVEGVGPLFVIGMGYIASFYLILNFFIAGAVWLLGLIVK